MSELNIEMRNGTVAIQEAKGDEVSAGGIILADPEASKGSLRMGKILGVGPGEYMQGHFVANTLKPGDEVVFDFGHCAPITIDAEKILMCSMVDVLAIVKKAPTED